jgi:hypothetical protein
MGFAGRMFAALDPRRECLLLTQGRANFPSAVAVLHRMRREEPARLERRIQVRDRVRHDSGAGDREGPEHRLLVGEMMKHRWALRGGLQALGRNGVYVTAIAQGSSELYISIVV